MKLLYIHQHFATKEGATGTRSYDVSKYLVGMGHQVTLICGINDHSTQKKPKWWQPFCTDWIDGIKVVTCNVGYSNKQRLPARVTSFARFAALAAIASLRESDASLVFATSPPLEVIAPGFFASRVHDRPFVFEVRDLWPEDIVDAGRIKRGGIGHRLMSMLEEFAYRSAARVFLVSRGFHDRMLERGYPDEFLRTILLGGDGSLFVDATPDAQYLRGLGIGDKFVAVYMGAHGVANGLFQVLDAAEHLRDRPDIAILCVGDGKEREKLLGQIRERGLSNVHMPGSMPKTRVPGILLGCHVGLQILTQVSRPRWVTPNKLFDYMFAGLPTIVNFAGTTAELVERERVGAASEPGSAVDLANKIRFYADHPQEREEVGRRAREIAWARYERKQIAAQLAAEFHSVIAEWRTGRQQTLPVPDEVGRMAAEV